MSYETRYAARKRHEFNDRANTPQAIAERLRRRAICEQVDRERGERFPTITAENVRDFIAWQDRRFAELGY